MRVDLAFCGVLVVSFVAQVGCAQRYHGSAGFGSEQQAQIEAYQDARRTPVAQVETAPDRTTPAPRIPLPQGLNAVSMADDSMGSVRDAAMPAPAAEAMAQPVAFAGATVAAGPVATPAATAAAAPALAPSKAPIFQSPNLPRPSVAATPAPATAPSQVNAGLHRFGELDAPLAANASPLDDQANLRRVTFTNEGADFDVEVDPTGQLLAYASTRHRQTSDIYLQRVNGTAVTQLTNDPAHDVMPCISPDGKQVAFTSDRAGTWDIYLMNIAGGPAIKLTDDGAQNIHPSFSPDGKQIVYSSRGSQSGVWELVIIDVASPAQRRIIGYGLFPVWSPTANKIAYQRARERGSRWFSVWTVEINNGEATRPTEIAASSNAAIITPEWSPDGRNIVFCTVLDPTTDSSAGSRADIWICNADGSGRARLTHGKYDNLYPTWAADGSIYFVSNRGVDAIENVYALRPDQAVYLARQRDATATPDTAEAAVPTPISE